MRVAVIGCGVVGAAIAYELSQVPGLSVTVLDRQPPAQASTGAALGVLMGIISQKVRGNAWAMRHDSLQRYETLIPELEALTGQKIPFNRQGILLLNFEDNRDDWQQLAAVRQTQGWQLEVWEVAQVQQCCPQVNCDRLLSAIYSSQDRQLDPTALTLALVAGAQKNGVQFEFGVEVERLEPALNSAEPTACHSLKTSNGDIAADWVIISAGLGSTALSQGQISIGPVLGQAVRVQLPHVMGDPAFQPCITGNDVHVVPLGGGEYWLGATVEFPAEGGAVIAQPERLQAVMEGAIALCPELAQAKLLQSWSGLRPRPQNHAAPVVKPLPGYRNVFLATGHYRNGVLLAPATAQRVREAILHS